MIKSADIQDLISFYVNTNFSGKFVIVVYYYYKHLEGKTVDYLNRLLDEDGVLGDLKEYPRPFSFIIFDKLEDAENRFNKLLTTDNLGNVVYELALHGEGKEIKYKTL